MEYSGRLAGVVEVEDVGPIENVDDYAPELERLFRPSTRKLKLRDKAVFTLGVVNAMLLP